MSGLGSLEMSGFAPEAHAGGKRLQGACHERAWFHHGDYA
jgi:hypothetical protein